MNESDYMTALQKLLQGHHSIPEMLEPEIPEQEPTSDLANIEQAILTVAESIKYLADTYAEVNAKPKTPRTYDDWLDVNDYELAPWRPVMVDDIIRPTGEGMTSTGQTIWSRKNAVCKVTKVMDNAAVHWVDVLDGEQGGGCHNLQGRFSVYEKRR